VQPRHRRLWTFRCFAVIDICVEACHGPSYWPTDLHALTSLDFVVNPKQGLKGETRRIRSRFAKIDRRSAPARAVKAKIKRYALHWAWTLRCRRTRTPPSARCLATSRLSPLGKARRKAAQELGVAYTDPRAIRLATYQLYWDRIQSQLDQGKLVDIQLVMEIHAGMAELRRAITPPPAEIELLTSGKFKVGHP